MKHNHLPLNLYRTPFTPAYWREASAAMSSLKLLVFAALMVAVTRALSMIPGIPIAHTKLTWGFLSRSLCALVCGCLLYTSRPGASGGGQSSVKQEKKKKALDKTVNGAVLPSAF